MEKKNIAEMNTTANVGAKSIRNGESGQKGLGELGTILTELLRRRHTTTDEDANGSGNREAQMRSTEDRRNLICLGSIPSEQ